MLIHGVILPAISLLTPVFMLTEMLRFIFCRPGERTELKRKNFREKAHGQQSIQ
jgi:hypothetical protein